MARKFLTAIDLAKNELQNGVIQNLGTAPSSPVKGQLYFNSTGGDNTLYWYNGAAWVPASGSAFPGYGAVPAETSYGIAKADGAATTVARSDHTHGSPALPPHNALTATADVAFSGFKLTGVGAPTAGTDATTKDYVDNLSAGLAWKDSVRVATMVPGTLASSFANGQSIDGVTLVTGNRILIKNQASNLENGIYTVNASGAPTRATDADSSTEIVNATVFVSEGTAHADTAWVCTANEPITLGTTPLPFVQFGAGVSYSAGNGLTLTGPIFDVGAGTGITVGADTVGITTGGVTNALLANMPNATFKGRVTGGTGVPEDMTVAEARNFLFGTTTLPIVVAAGGTGQTAYANFNSVICAGTTTTGALQAIGGGTTGQYLKSAGAGVLPAYATIAQADISGLPAALTGKTGKYTIATIGGATSQVVTHNLNTQAVVVSVYRTLTPWDEVDCDIEHTSVNTVTLRFAVAPAANEYSCTVIG